MTKSRSHRATGAAEIEDATTWFFGVGGHLVRGLSVPGATRAEAVGSRLQLCGRASSDFAAVRAGGRADLPAGGNHGRMAGLPISAGAGRSVPRLPGISRTNHVFSPAGVADDGGA